MELKGRFKTSKEGIAFVEESLPKLKVSSKELVKATAYVQHALAHLIEKPDKGADITIVIRKTILFTDIRVEVPGKKIDIRDDCDREGHYDYSRVIAKTFHKTFHDIITYRHVRGVNKISFTVAKSSSRELAVTLIALAAGIFAGIFCKLVLGEKISGIIDYYVLDLIKTMFMKILKVIVGPVVFFSIASCLTRYTNLKVLGRIGAKTMALYFLTTIVAIGIGFCLYKACPVGNPGMMKSAESVADDSEEAVELDELMEDYGKADFSIRNLIVESVPDNIFKAFIDVNLLQIIILALIVGLAISRCGENAAYLNDFIEAFYKLFTSLTEIITKFVPIVIFCSMAGLIIEMGMETLISIASYAGMVIVGMLCMLVFYGIFILVTTGLNPLIFYKKFSKAMSTAFAVSSGPATMPTSLACCRKMGIDEMVSSFTIPLGSNINMDGSCMVFVITVLFMARIYGIELSGGMLLSLVISIIFLALGSPTVAGADLVIIAVLFEQIGVPIEAIGLILGIDAIFDMVQAVSNTTGDAAVTLVVAKSEELLDVDKYKQL